MALDEPRDDEVATPINGIDVLIAEEIKGYADRSTVDYITGPYGEGFKVGVGGHSGC